MRYCLVMLLFIPVFTSTYGQGGDNYPVPDSIKATGFYAEISIPENNPKKKGAGIAADEASMIIGHEQDRKLIQFRFFGKTKGADIVTGKDIYRYGPGNAWNYEWKYNENYPLLILTATDSASRKTLVSGYVFLPEVKKWKLISTRLYRDTGFIKTTSIRKSKRSTAAYTNRWLQRSNGSWKALDAQTANPPSLRQMSNIDSLYQQKLEEDLLRSKLPKEGVGYEDGVFYQSLREGFGRPVHVTDTLTVHYKGSLYSDGTVFDQTKEKPATFPLERLIKGWQLGLVHAKVGGMMRLYITSGSAYGIRTRSANIPPNSILVFDVEVLNAKEKK